MPPTTMIQKPGGPSAPVQTLNIDALKEVLDLLACPACLGALRATPASFACEDCGRHYPVLDGIPILLVDRAIPPAQPR